MSITGSRSIMGLQHPRHDAIGADFHGGTVLLHGKGFEMKGAFGHEWSLSAFSALLPGFKGGKGLGPISGTSVKGGSLLQGRLWQSAGKCLVDSRAFHLVGMHVIGDVAYLLGWVACNDSTLGPSASRFEKGQGAHNAPRADIDIVHDHGIHSDQALCA